MLSITQMLYLLLSRLTFFVLGYYVGYQSGVEVATKYCETRHRISFDSLYGEKERWRLRTYELENLKS